jgi:hypothetical protein
MIQRCWVENQGTTDTAITFQKTWITYIICSQIPVYLFRKITSKKTGIPFSSFMLVIFPKLFSVIFNDKDWTMWLLGCQQQPKYFGWQLIVALLTSLLLEFWQCQYGHYHSRHSVAYPGFFLVGVGVNKFSWGQRERKSGGGSPLVRGSTQFSNEWNPDSD